MRRRIGLLRPTGWAWICLTCLFLALLPDALAQDLADAASRRGTEGAAPDSHGLDAIEIRTVPAGPQYGMGSFGALFFGDEYREVWTEPISMPVLDMETTAGGLRVTGSAGGMQTSLLFLEGADGRAFILRKVQKDAGAALPEGAQRTIIEDIAQDQISALNPYSAFVIPPLAEAARVLSTAPTLVIVPDDARLGEYRGEFAGAPALIERKVDEDVSDVARFGYPEAVLAFDDMLARIEADPNEHVDQRAFVRTRLFDMWIGDRDRHDGQYFWAAMEDRTTGGTRFVPLPIDRDFAFARFDGLLNRIGRFSGNIDFRKLTYFGEDIDDLVGLNYQGAKLDYRFTGEMTREDWAGEARALQQALTDSVIEAAIHSWPAPVYDAVGEETIQVLERRRDELDDTADEYYEMLVQKVDVVGTDRSERFTVDRREDGSTIVTTSHDGKRSYRRRFTDETEEIRVFGQGGDDEVVVSGAPGNDTIILAVGGEGDDRATSPDGSAQKAVSFYDSELPEQSRDVVEFEEVDDSSGLHYAFHRYQLDKVAPSFNFDYDSDHGIFIGGGVKLTRYGFRREPYAAHHVFRGNYGPMSRAFNLHYDGEMNELIGEWDARWEADVLDEEEFNDFYGFGNETPGTDAHRRQYIAHFQWVRAFPAFYRDLGRYVTVGVGPYFEYANIEPPSGFSEEAPPAGFEPVQLEDKYFAGVRTRLVVDTRDSKMMAQSGVYWRTDAGYNLGIRNGDMSFSRLASDMRAYVSPLPGRATLALRVGAATNVGRYAFYQANTLGGRENLRGFNKTRFSGRSAAFGNAELRVKLADVNVYLTRGEVGVLGFFDAGRVWADDEASDVLHRGYGAGIWATPFYRIVVQGRVGFSDEGSVTRLTVGMFY